MASPIVIITAIESGLGFLLTSAILYLLLSRGRKTYHYLFAAFLLVCAFWDLGTFLLMIRNNHLDELVKIGYIITLPCGFIPALIFHFACAYTGRLIKWAIWLVWALTGLLTLLTLARLAGNIEDVYTYSWGNIFKITPGIFGPLTMVIWFGFNLSACWLVYKGSKKATSPMEKRHYQYILAGLLVITFAVIKVGVVMGIDVPIILPLGMFLVDVFNAIIGIAILKERLFDITVIIQKSAIYSALAAILIFVFSFSEHVLITYFGKLMGERSEMIHLVSIAVGIAVLMPLKQRVEHAIDHYFAQRKLVF
jgi:hypothetical protein